MKFQALNTLTWKIRQLVLVFITLQCNEDTCNAQDEQVGANDEEQTAIGEGEVVRRNGI